MVAAHASGSEGMDQVDASSLVAGTVGILFSLADAAGIDAADVVEQSQNNSGFLAPISNSLESVLKTLQGGLAAVHVPYSYGFSIILLTVLVKIVTYPFTKKQVRPLGLLSIALICRCAKEERIFLSLILAAVCIVTLDYLKKCECEMRVLMCNKSIANGCIGRWVPVNIV